MMTKTKRVPPPVPPRIHPARAAELNLKLNTSQPHRLSIPISLLVHQPSGQHTPSPSASPSPPSATHTRTASVSSQARDYSRYCAGVHKSPSITTITLNDVRRPTSSGHVAIYHSPPSPVSSIAYSSRASSPPYSIFSDGSSFSLSGKAYLTPADRTRIALKKQARRYQARKKYSRNREAMAAAVSVEAARRFFSAKHFAVAGASQDTAKYGYKPHNLSVTPVNPRSPVITLNTVAGQPSLQAVASPSALPAPSETSLSIVTPPAVTKSVLREAHEVGVRAVWMQPGSFDNECVEYARANFEAAVAGEEERLGGEGWCVLVHGEAAMKRSRM